MSSGGDKHISIAGVSKEAVKDDADMGISIATSRADSGNTGIAIKSSSGTAATTGTNIKGTSQEAEKGESGMSLSSGAANPSSGEAGIAIKSSASAVGQSIKGTAKEAGDDDVEMDIGSDMAQGETGNSGITIKSAVAPESGSAMDTSVMPAKIPKVTATDAQSSVEGWVVIATGVHEEAREEEVLDFFSDYGKVRGLHLNLDRQTGFVKGYALVEYEKLAEAEAAVSRGSGKRFLGQAVQVDFAFIKDTVADSEASMKDNESDEEEGTLEDRVRDRHPRRRTRQEYRPDPRQSRQRELSPDRGF